MESTTKPLFSPKQQLRVVKVMQQVLASKLKDPENSPSPRDRIKALVENREAFRDMYKPDAYDFSKPETLYREAWHMYLSFAVSHGMPKTARSRRGQSTMSRRKGVVKTLRHYLGRTPASEDLQEAFPNVTHLDAELQKIIDADLKNL